AKLARAAFSATPPPLLLIGTPFQHKVWRALLRIKPGTTTSYGALAEKLNTAPRALGGAVGANPVSCLVPCHRVLDGKGGLNGYRWGLGVKRQLLQAEGAA
ncbi:MAG: methylated-DNA--[protein]-cysteine S-methyltransferase, partial [Rhodobiaceae bacterium]